jgi:hypothetical protein
MRDHIPLPLPINDLTGSPGEAAPARATAIARPPAARPANFAVPSAGAAAPPAAPVAPSPVAPGAASTAILVAPPAANDGSGGLDGSLRPAQDVAYTLADALLVDTALQLSGVEAEESARAMKAAKESTAVDKNSNTTPPTHVKLERPERPHMESPHKNNEERLDNM